VRRARRPWVGLVSGISRGILRNLGSRIHVELSICSDRDLWDLIGVWCLQRFS
jgi:hypothetical protein